MTKHVKIILALISTGLFLYGFGILVKLYSADKYSHYSQRLFDAGSVEKAYKHADLAISNNPLEPLYYIKRARIYFALNAGEDEATRRGYKILALEDLRSAYNLNPNNLITIKHLIPLYYFLASFDITKPAGPQNIDSEFIDISDRFYKSVFSKAPNDVGFYTLLYKYEKRLGLESGVDKAQEKIFELRPDIFEWYSDLE